MNTFEKYQNLLQQVKKGGNPTVLVNACTHGDELIGLKVIEQLKKYNICKGQLLFNVANETAVNGKVRFIDSDLNRAFPGNLSGDHESKIAYYMSRVVKEVDIFLDIHSTTTNTTDLLIVEKLDNVTKNVLNIISPERVVCFENPAQNTSISCAKVGIGFEYGKDSSKKAISASTKGILRVLDWLGMIKTNRVRKSGPKKKIEYYSNVHPVIKPEGYALLSHIENFRLVRKGEEYATNGNQHLIAKANMYPILFGNTNYPNIFGFVAYLKKVE